MEKRLPFSTLIPSRRRGGKPLLEGENVKDRFDKYKDVHCWNCKQTWCSGWSWTVKGNLCGDCLRTLMNSKDPRDWADCDPGP